MPGLQANLLSLRHNLTLNIFIIKDSKKVNAKNIMDILMLAASIDSEG